MAIVSLSPLFNGWQGFTSGGIPLSGGLLNTYLAGTSTPAATYTTNVGNIANSNPIVLDGAGRPPAEIWQITGQAYRYVLTDSTGSNPLTYDNIIGLGDQSAQLAADLADTSNAAKGAGLVGYRGPQSAPADTVAERLSWDIYVTDPQFGAAVNDGVTDSTAALAAAVTYANSLCDIASDSTLVGRYPRLIFPAGLGFVTTATLSIRAGVNVLMYSPLYVTAAAGTPIIGIDMTDAKGVAFQSPRGTDDIFDVRRVIQSDWSSENDIGVRIVGLYVGTPYFRRIQGFCVGADVCLGYGNTTINEIRNAKIGFKVNSRTSPNQFTNQGRFTGGAFACDGGVNAGLARYGIKVLGVTPSGANTLVFEGQSYEINKPTAGVADCIPIIVDGTAANCVDIRFLNQRGESNGGTFARLLGSVREVEIAVLYAELGYTNPTSLLLDDQSTSGGNNVLYRTWGADGPLWKEFFNTGTLAEKSVQLTGGLYSVVNMEAMTNAGASPTPPVFSATGGAYAIDASGFMTQSGPFYGVRVRLNGAKSIGITGRKSSGSAVNVYMTCFDSSGTQITASTAIMYEQSAASVNTGIYGGLYSFGINPANAATIFEAVASFASNVATVFIAIPTACSGWQLKRQDARAEWFSSTSHLKDQFVGDTLPVALTNVTYKAGMRVVRSAPAVGSAKAWVCTAPGVPTFVSEGNL